MNLMQETMGTMVESWETWKVFAGEGVNTKWDRLLTWLSFNLRVLSL